MSHRRRAVRTGRIARWVLCGLCVVPCPVWAGQVVLSWDYPLGWQPGTTYVLRIVTLQGGVPTGTTRTIAPFTPQQCAQWPNPTDTPETLCGPVCLNPGDYTLSLYAVHGGQ